MTRTARLARIAGHEFRVTAANKGFVITTLIGPLLILAVAALPTLGMRMATRSGIAEGTSVAVSAPEGRLADALERGLADAGLPARMVDSSEAARRLVAGDETDAAVVIGHGELDSYTFVTAEGTDLRLAETVEQVVTDVVVAHRLSEAGLNAAEVNRLTEPPQMQQRTLGSGTQSDDPFAEAFVGAFAFVFLLYMTVIFYGQSIARSVLAERTSRTVEIMLSSVRPLELMLGKVLGKGGAGIIQYGFWIVVAVVAGRVVAPGLELPVPEALSFANLATLVLFFIAAFLLYSSAYAAIGAGAADEQHIGQLGLPLLAMLIVPMILIAPIIVSPSSPLTVALSIFPFTAPIVMLVRFVIGSPPVSHIALSLALLLVSIGATGWVSARIFRVALLISGSRPSLRQLLRYARSG